MEAILRTNVYNDDYELVVVVKNPISDRNRLAQIIDSNGDEKWTGGILVRKDETTMKILDTLTPIEQWELLKGKSECFVR